MQAFRHRKIGSLFLSGHGLEIGALHDPFQIPGHCSAEYLDVENVQTLRLNFPELEGQSLVDLHYIGDIGQHPLPEIAYRTFTFIVLIHVLEHVANPIQVIQHIWSGIRDDGYFVVAVPDKNFTFDRTRPLTTFEHLLADYFRDISQADDDHYIDFLAHVHPEVFLDRERFLQALQSVRKRREHVHVWDSHTFKLTFKKILAFLDFEASTLYESDGATNQFEYFAVVKKGQGRRNCEEALQVLFGIFASRPDLQQAFPPEQEQYCSQLLKWAVTAGSTFDSAREILEPYKSCYESMTEKANDTKEYNEKFKRLCEQLREMEQA